jgi:RNA polymerase sigma-70 factor, ECF subfamily
MAPEAFREIFEEHLAFVWRVLRRHGVPARELDDGCQDVFLVVFRRLPEFQGRSSLRTWIYAVAVRVALAVRRRAYFRREVVGAPIPEQQSGESDAHQALLQQEARAQLLAALEVMPRPKREVFVLHEIEGMTLSEAAAALGVPENTALYRLHSARASVLSHVRRREHARGPRRDRLHKALVP